MNAALFRLLALLSLLLAACQPEIINSTPPPAELWRMQLTPELRWLGPIFNTCARQAVPDHQVAVIVDEVPASAMDGSQAAFIFRWNPGDSVSASYAAIVAEVELAVIVNPKNSLPGLEQADLQAIFSGKVTTWDQVSPKDCQKCIQQKGPIQPLVYPDGVDTGQAFETIFPGFNTNPTSSFLAPDPQAVHDIVASNPQAIGFVPAEYVDSRVLAIKINGLSPQALHLPLVVSAQAEPSGAKLAWLACLQETIK